MLRHTPVLAKEIYENLPKNLATYFDGTFWHGGHAEYILATPLLRAPHEAAGKGVMNIKTIQTI